MTEYKSLIQKYFPIHHLLKDRMERILNACVLNLLEVNSMCYVPINQTNIGLEFEEIIYIFAITGMLANLNYTVALPKHGFFF